MDAFSRLKEFHFEVCAVLAFSLATELLGNCVTSAERQVVLFPPIFSSLALGGAALWLALLRRRSSEEYWAHWRHGELKLSMDVFFERHVTGSRSGRWSHRIFMLSALFTFVYAVPLALKLDVSGVPWSHIGLEACVIGASFMMLIWAFTLHYKTFAFFNLVQVVYFLIGGYVAVVVPRSFPTWMLPMAGVAVGAFCAWAVEWGLLLKAQRKGVTPGGLLLMSLGIYFAVRGVCTLFAGPGVRFLRLREVVTSVGSASLTAFHLLQLLAASLVFMGIVVLQKSPAGLALRATVNDFQLAEIAGVSTKRVRLLVTVSSGAIFGAAGSIHALDAGVLPQSGLQAILYAAAFGLAIQTLSASRVAVAALALGGMVAWCRWKWGGPAADVAILTLVERIGWHALRHSYATLLCQRGVPLRNVQELLGHTTILMTSRYAHASPSDTARWVYHALVPASEDPPEPTFAGQSGHQVATKTLIALHSSATCPQYSA